MPFNEEWLIAHASGDTPNRMAAYIGPDEEGRLWLSLYSDDGAGNGVMVVNVALGDLKKVCR